MDLTLKYQLYSLLSQILIEDRSILRFVDEDFKVWDQLSDLSHCVAVEELQRSEFLDLYSGSPFLLFHNDAVYWPCQVRSTFPDRMEEFLDRLSLDTTTLSIMVQASGLATMMLMLREFRKDSEEISEEELQGLIIAYRYHYQLALDLMLEAMREDEDA